MGNSRGSHRVFAAVDHRQADHQGTVVETTGAIRGTSLSILFDSGAIDSFIAPFVVGKCSLKVVKQDIGW